jgi:hypothetical protein
VERVLRPEKLMMNAAARRVNPVGAVFCVVCVPVSCAGKTARFRPSAAPAKRQAGNLKIAPTQTGFVALGFSPADVLVL